MGDPLSIAASVAGLLSLGLQSTEYLYKFYAAYRDQHRDLARIVDQLTGLRETLQIITSTVHARTWRPDKQRIVRVIEEAVTRSEGTIHALQDEVSKFKQEPKGDWRKRAVVVGRRAAYPFKRSTLEDLGDDVDTFRDNLSIALQALELKEHQNTQDEIQVVNTIVKSIQAYSVSADVRQWLRAPDATVDFNDACAKRHPGTGQWLVQGASFTTWLHQDNSFLWLYGFAGCGKSVLCSTSTLFTINAPPPAPRSPSSSSPSTTSRNGTQVPGLEADLSRLKETSSHGSPSLSALLDYLRSAVIRCRHIYIVLDALDESPADSSRPALLSVIKTIRGWQQPGLHLLVTSRDVQDIRDSLHSLRVLTDAEQVALKNDGIHQDISQYVAHQVDHDPKLLRWGTEQEKIKKYLTSKADGVFQWVECQLAPLRTCARSQRVLDKCLRMLPRGLDQTYERMLCQIGDESREEAQQILSLLCYAPRPLTVEEVIEMVAVDLDDLECYDRARRFNDAYDLLRTCPGLIEISLESSQMVRIAHFSVQEYLLSDRIQNGQAADFALPAPIQHARIGKACLLYLSDSDFLQQTLSVDLVRRYAFARYAAQYWHYHHRLADSQLAERLLERTASFLTTRHTRERWIRLYDPDAPWRKGPNYNKSTKDPSSSIYYASLFGLDRVLALLLSIPAADVNAQGEEYGSALQAASEYGHEKVVQILLDKGADVNAQGGEYGSALQAASERGHEQVVHILLDRGADVNAQKGYFSNALQAASAYSHKQVVQILLDKGADINAQGGCYGSALQAALGRGHEQVVQMLLDKGADVNAQGGKYGNTLQAASVGGHEQVVQMLLDKGADVNAQGGKYGNALQAASVGGREQVVQILLDTGADVNAQGGECGNALQAASESGHEKVVQILLDRGADINARGGEYSSALQAASAYSHEQVVQILLDKGADVNA